jgi:hypothetical protein
LFEYICIKASGSPALRFLPFSDEKLVEEKGIEYVEQRVNEVA